MQQEERLKISGKKSNFESFLYYQADAYESLAYVDVA
jgi:hypothetical protein